MDRRKSIKALVLGTVSTGVLVEACNNADTKAPGKKDIPTTAANDDRMVEEVAYNKELQEEKFFTAREMATLSVLADIIIPKDEVSGSATEAGVPDFIEFMVKDRPENQTPMRGGLRWLDLHCLKQYDNPFKDCTPQQQLEVVDKIAYPQKAQPELKQGVNFFSRMRNLTISGFYTSKMGVADVGYIGNRPNQWNGVPDDVQKQYNMAYSEKELKECMNFDKA